LSDDEPSPVHRHLRTARDNLANIPARYTHPADATGTTGPDATTLATGDSGARAACGAPERVAADVVAMAERVRLRLGAR